MKDYFFDKECYEHSLCHYFAIEMAKLYHCPICFWIDEFLDVEGNPLTVLCHTFVKLAQGIYVDAYGVFRDISEREDEFEFNNPEPVIKVCETLEETKKFLKNLKIPFTDVECKRNAREFLRNHLLTLAVDYNGHVYNFAIKGYIIQRDTYLCSQYNSGTGIIGKYIRIIPKSIIEKGFIYSFDFIFCKDWWAKGD